MSNILNRLSVAAIFAAYANSPAMALPPPDESPPSSPPSFVATAVPPNQINLSWGASSDDRGVTGYYLQRCLGGSCQSRISLATTPRTYSATNLAAGAYTFHLSAKDAAGNESDTVSRSAAVGPPPQVDSLTIQRTYVYETRLGDINGDSLIDVYVNRTSGGTPGNGNLEWVILQQIAGGKFTTIVPTSAQTTTASGWPTNSINMGVEDINFDGYVDLVLELKTKIPAALDQIVYAPAQAYVSTPKGIKAVDPAFLKFVRDLSDWIKKPNYFQSGAPLVQQPIFSYVQQCVSYCNYSNSAVQTCFSVPVVVGRTPAYDYSGFSQPAVGFGQIVSQAGRGTLSAENAGQLKTILETALGVGILAANDSSGCGCTLPEWTWPDAERNNWLARLLKVLIFITTKTYVQEDENTTFYHYTPEINVPSIVDSGTLRSNTGLVYMTTALILSGIEAFERLSLDYVPGVGIILDSDQMGDPQPLYLGPVPPGDQGQPGNGPQYTKPSPVPIGNPPRIFNLGS